MCVVNGFTSSIGVRWGGYGHRDLAGDVYASVISAAAMLPLALAYGVASDLSLSFLIDATQPAATIALVGSIDTLLTAVVARSMTGQRNNPDRDLLGQGLGTLASGVLSGLPGGATVCTIGNIRAGARSRVSGVPPPTRQRPQP